MSGRNVLFLRGSRSAAPRGRSVSCPRKNVASPWSRHFKLRKEGPLFGAGPPRTDSLQSYRAFMLRLKSIHPNIVELDFSHI